MKDVAKNVVVLVVDRLQAGMLGAYGNAWIHTPQIDRLAAGAFVFDQAFACEPTLDAVLSALWKPPLLQSLLTDDPQVYEHPLAASFADRTLVELPQTIKRAAKEIEKTQLAEFFAAATDRIATTTEPNVLWLHSRGFAGPWDAPLELRHEYAEEDDPTPPDFTRPPNRTLPADFDPDELLGITHAYAGQVSLFDTCLGVLLDSLEASPLASSTLFVLVGVRGFPLGEHGRVGECDAALYQELTHVPLVVRFPNGEGTLARTSALATHTDVAELLAGSSEVVAIVRGEQANWRDHLRFASTHDRGIRTASWYLRAHSTEHDKRPELYVKPDDRWEINDVADRLPEIANQLAEVLAAPVEPSLRLPEALIASHE